MNNKRKRDFYGSSKDIFTSDLDSLSFKKLETMPYISFVPSVPVTNEVQPPNVKEKQNEMNCSIISANNIEEMVFTILCSQKYQYSKEEVLKVIEKVCSFLLPPPPSPAEYSYIS